MALFGKTSTPEPPKVTPALGARGSLYERPTAADCLGDYRANKAATSGDRMIREGILPATPATPARKRNWGNG